MQKKIKIAVSSCLLGEAVRYDGTDKHIAFITQQLIREYTLISVCPEIEVGMGVPRSPIHLVDNGCQIQALYVHNPAKNMTQPLADFGQSFIKMHPDICGYVFKKHSPSCGVKNVKVMNTDGFYERRGQGVYAAAIMKQRPLLPVIDEDDCLNESAIKDFKVKVLDYFNNRLRNK